MNNNLLNPTLGDLLGSSSDPLALASTAASASNTAASSNNSATVPSSFGSLLAGITSLASTGIGAYNAVAGVSNTNATVPTTTTTTTTGSSFSQYLPLAVIGGVIFVILALFNRK